MIHFLCPFCRKSHKAKDKDAGKKCRCSSCNLLIDIPGTKVVDQDEESQDVEPETEAESIPTLTPAFPVDLPHRGSYQPQFQKPWMVGAIQGFLVFAGIFFTIITMIGCVIALYEGRYDKWHTFGAFIGIWFMIMVNVSLVWLVSEIVVCLRERRY